MIIRISEQQNYPAEWTSRREDVVMQNPRIGLIQHVITCNGKGTPKYDQPILVTKGGVVCIVHDSENNLAVLKRYREVCAPISATRTAPIIDGSMCGACSYEFPRGGQEAGESESEAAIRETEEEVGMIVKRANWLGRINPDTAFFPYSQEVFMVEIDRGRPASAPRDPNEEIEVLFMSPREVFERIRSGDIYCGLTKAALATYMAHLFDRGDLSTALAR